MTPRQEIRQVSVDLNTPDLLHYLIKERFPGKTVITASLMASSIVVLDMVSKIDPETPVVFCQRPPFFQESAEYRTKIVERLGLSNTSVSEGRETAIETSGEGHCERMWLHYRDMPGRSYQLLHLNESLASYDCWISAVYHTPRPDSVQHRVDVDGHVIRVDPLLRWSSDDVRDYMHGHKLPYHKMASREFTYKDLGRDMTAPTYHF